MSAGSSGVSFWGGTGADSFSFGYISNAAGTAYFWNDQVGIDTIVFDASAATNTNNFQFGVTGNSGIQFTLDDAYTSAFSSLGISGAFSLAGSAENATALFSTTAVTLDFADGTSLIFGSSSNSFTTAFATGFSITLDGGTGAADSTLNFGNGLGAALPTFS